MNEDKATSEIGNPTPPTRHEEFYYEDGNICLQAENTIFRLLKSQLARQSDMFTDMFFVGGEQQGILVEGEVYDGVPLVRVEERAEDWTIVCQLLWNPPADERPKDFDTIASVLRISTKYSMDKLRKCFVKWFEEATLHSAHRFGANPLPILEHYDSKPNLAAKVIVVAKECDVRSVLPVALYYVAVTSSSTLSRPIGLPYDDVVRIMIGRDRLLVKWWNLVRGSESLGLDESVGRCGFRVGHGPSKLRCGEFKLDSSQLYPRVQMLEDGSRDPLRYLSRQSRNRSLCAKCRAEHHEAMLEIYNSLETVFDLK